MYFTYEKRPLAVFTSIPAGKAMPRRSNWADINLAGQDVGCFLEGPDFDPAGNLYVVDIPYGRIFRIDRAGAWSVVADYDGWPNGLKVGADGRLLVTDCKNGLLRIDPDGGKTEVLFGSFQGRPLLGLNDLSYGPDGALYVTDQGQTGLHEPKGRVFRISPDGIADLVLDGCPSPNGLVHDKQKPWLYVAMTRGNCIWRVPFHAGKVVKAGIAIQLSGGIGPDGIAMDAQGRLLVAHLQIGIWLFDRKNRPVILFEVPEDSYITNLVVRDGSLYATDSISGQILTAELPD